MLFKSFLGIKFIDLKDLRTAVQEDPALVAKVDAVINYLDIVAQFIRVLNLFSKKEMFQLFGNFPLSPKSGPHADSQEDPSTAPENPKTEETTDSPVGSPCTDRPENPTENEATDTPENPTENEATDTPEETPVEDSEEKPKPTRRRKSRKIGNKRKLPKGPIIEHLLTDEQRTCSCCKGPMSKSRSNSRTIIVSMPFFTTETHNLEVGRCPSCLTQEIAQAPAILNQTIGRYHHSACALIVGMKYLKGFPSLRLDLLSDYSGLRVPDSTQWDIAEGAGDKLHEFFKFLEKYAANTSLGLTDDTGAHVISLRAQIDKDVLEALKKGLKQESVRTGINTTLQAAVFEKGCLAIYKTGRHHLGECLENLLELRTLKKKLIVMADGSSNTGSRLRSHDNVEIINCNVHAFRKFKELAESEKALAKAAGRETEFLSAELFGMLWAYGVVFQNEKDTAQLTPAERLAFHQEHSLPVMEALRETMKIDIETKKVEPNSRLGKAYAYFMKRFDRLIGFCRLEGVPLDNNLAERLLKVFIRLRHGSQFFRNSIGAKIADIHCTILISAQINKINPIQYLQDLLNHPDHWKKNPEEWLPWNYEKTIAAIKNPGACETSAAA